MQAIWEGSVLAESDATILVEGNHYFPPEAVNWDLLESTQSRTSCFWKGQAHYFSVNVAGKTNPDSAWTYPEPLEGASELRNHVAFWRGVQVH